MKCPHCGAWNQAYLPKCVRCGAPLDGNTQTTKSWEADMHKKKPSLRVVQFEAGDSDVQVHTPDAPYDPEALDAASLTDELEELVARRQEGETRKAQLRRRAERVARSMQEAEIIVPQPEPEDLSGAEGDSAAIRQRQEYAQQQYTAQEGAPQPSSGAPYGYFGDTRTERPLTYDDTDPTAPYYYDGYTPDSGDQGALTDEEYMPRRFDTRSTRENTSDPFDSGPHERHRLLVIIAKIFGGILCCALMALCGVLVARQFVLYQGLQARKDTDTTVVLSESAYDGHPAHTLTIFGKENATVYIRETQSSYVIANGKVEITIPDYMWYDTDSSTFATAVDTDTMDVTITPFIRYTQEGEQFALEPVNYTIDVPLSTIYLLNPSTLRAEVGVSIFEIRLNVEPGSTVIIDGANVSTLIRETGNVSKNVPVLPVGDNVISISVKSKYCRENKMEVTLFRAPQDIPLELDATVISEWNYEPVTEEKYNNASNDEKSKLYVPSITGTTLPGAKITVETPHWGLEQDFAKGTFSFHPLFSTLGDNDVVIRASYEGKTDSVITHTVYYMPNWDIYTRRAWDLDSQYNDLINNINQRKGTIYLCTGTIQQIISTTPQLAIMNIGTDSFEKLVMLENSSKTTWTVGTKYRVYGDAYGMYDTMPRITVRYTYLAD